MNAQWIRPELAGFILVLWVLAVLFVSVGLWIVRRVQSTVHKTLLVDGRIGGSRMRIALRSLALASWAVVLAGPSWGQRTETPAVYQREVMLAIDMSASMRAEDLPPNRLVRMREMVHRLLEAAPGYRYGLIVFAGDAWERIPYTYDRDYIEQVLAETDPADIRPQGTDLVRTVERAMEIAQRNSSTDSTLVLFTDGEHTGQAPVDAAVQLARRNGIRVLAVSLGLPEGAAIPVASGGQLRDRQGQVVYSKPDRAFLQRLASETGGVHLAVDQPTVSAELLVRALQSVEARRTEETRRVAGIDRSVWWIAAGWFLLLLSLLPLRVWSGATMGMRRSSSSAVLLTLLTLLGSGCGPQDEGSQLYRNGDYAQASQWFAGEAVRTGDPAALHNMGASLYRLEQYPVSMTASAAAATRTTEPDARGDAFYNAGNAAYRLGDYVRAVQLYQLALEARDDEDTRVNLEIATRKLSELQRQAEQPRVQPQPQPGSGDTTSPSAPQSTSAETSQPATNAQSQARQADPAAQPPGSEASDASAADEDAADPKPPEQSSVFLRKRLEDVRERNALAYPDRGQASGDKPW